MLLGDIDIIIHKDDGGHQRVRASLAADTGPSCW